MGRNNPWEFDWTDAAIERLKELWAEGLSASECGKHMGVSRNSIIGKVHRLGLSGKYRRPRQRRPRMRAKAKPARLLETPEQVSNLRICANPQTPPSPPSDPPIGGFGLFDLRHGMCRWPEGERPYRFCGAPQAFDSSYCEAHHAMAHARGSQRDFDRAAEAALGGKLFASRAGIEQ